MSVYFDQAAAARPDPEVLAYYGEMVRLHYANQEATHSLGYELRRKLDRAAAELSTALTGHDGCRVIWGMNGTELFNLFADSPVAAGKRVLNVFSYTGGFSVSCMKGGARAVVNIDSSREALKQAEKHLDLNHISTDRVDNLQEDAFNCMRKMLEQKEKFDLVILDPPKLIDGTGSITRGCRAYKDLARLGFSLLNKGGLLMNFSCSGLMTPELFQKITADGALDAGVDGQILRTLRQGMDHPVSLAVPESFYLKGLLCTCK